MSVVCADEIHHESGQKRAMFGNRNDLQELLDAQQTHVTIIAGVVSIMVVCPG